MSENPEDHIRKTPRKPKLKLPFDNRREDAGTWAYDHRVGLCVTLIAYLLLMIVFVSSKIVVGRRASQQGMYIDLQTLAELEKERDRLEREVRERQEQDPIDWGSIRNRASNENALNERLRDDRGTNTAALKEAAAEAEAREVAAENPLEFKVALIFTALFVLFTLLTYWVMQYGGRYGMSLLSVASGVSDITPFVLNLLGHDSVLPARQIGICVLQALASNVVVNMGYAYFFSGRRRDFVPQLRLVFLPVLVLHLLLLGVFYII